MGHMKSETGHLAHSKHPEDKRVSPVLWARTMAVATDINSSIGMAYTENMPSSAEENLNGCLKR